MLSVAAIDPNFPVVDRYWRKTMGGDQLEIVVRSLFLQKYSWRFAIGDELPVERTA